MFEPLRAKRNDGPTGREAVPSWKWIAAVAFLLSLPSQILFGQSVENDVTFTFTTDPAEAVLMLGTCGRQTAACSTFTVFGDGRLEYRGEDRHGYLRERHELFLQYDEVVALLRLAVDHNLAAASKEDVEAKLRARHRRGSLPRVIDGGDSILEISLTSYQRGGEERGPINNEISLHDPDGLSRFYDIEELHGFAALSRQMSDYLRIARERLKKETK